MKIPMGLRGQAQRSPLSLKIRDHPTSKRGLWHLKSKKTANGETPIWTPYAWTGHLIAEADEAAPRGIPDSRPVQPGGAWCVHPRPQGPYSEQRRRKKRRRHDLYDHVDRPQAPAAEVAPSAHGSHKPPQ